MDWGSGRVPSKQSPDEAYARVTGVRIRDDDALDANDRWESA